MSAVNTARLSLLICLEHELNLKLQFLFQQRLFFMGYQRNMLNLTNQYAPGSAEDKLFQTRIAQLKSAEEELQIRINMSEKELESVQKERDQLSKATSENIQRDFRGAYGAQ